ncbi:MAG: deoxyuridine 5'-triphosphate nucleotidohydrolase [Clostridia bacterium]|nr:deoxyuridine 5'-triphosphate nucleotidohydrolase [Clostridia bacterium]MBQ6980062.1 deoxyuridine 5'-triphosphate nucleotidohydrolase [Clostridia bacterium]MBQ9513794.1 deoxyuridine 5'-triphosphate nucleotidohydrolase [Clostridia bacterium]
MKQVAKFYLVSEQQYTVDGKAEDYKSVKLPKRATKGSAGYDFFAPFDICLKPNDTIKVPTGIRVKIDNGWFLAVFPRSSLGFKYRLKLDNTVGIIDSDYYNAENEGHIFIKMTNAGDKELVIEKGKAFAQGIFLQYGITVDDDSLTERVGGIGSTDIKC